MNPGYLSLARQAPDSKRSIMKKMKWIETGAGVLLVLLAHIGGIFLGWNFKLCVALTVIALFIAAHLVIVWARGRLARRFASLPPAELEASLADLDDDDRETILLQIERLKGIEQDL